jgi:hypothetical protein
MPVIKKSAPTKLAPQKLAPQKLVAKKAAPSTRPEDDDDEPTQRGPRVGKATQGWDGASALGKGGDFIKSVDWKNDSHGSGDQKYFIVKFLDDGPYANLKIHWLERKGKRSFVCVGDDCPLCAIGDDPKGEFRFNVAVLTGDTPVVRSLNSGWKLFSKIRNKAEAPLTKPLSKRFYLLTRSGRQWHEIQYDIEKIDPEEITTAYSDFYVPTAEEIEALVGYSLDDVAKEYTSMSELEDVAAEVMEGE